MVGSKNTKMKTFIVVTSNRMFVASVVHETFDVNREENYTVGVGYLSDRKICITTVSMLVAIKMFVIGKLGVLMTRNLLSWIVSTGMCRWIKCTHGPF